MSYVVEFLSASIMRTDSQRGEARKQRQEVEERNV